MNKRQNIAKLKRIESLIETLPEAEIRRALLNSFRDLYTTEDPYCTESGRELDWGRRLLTPDEDFPSGADFIDCFIDNLPSAIRERLP